jgi:hypothetical protein
MLDLEITSLPSRKRNRKHHPTVTPLDGFSIVRFTPSRFHYQLYSIRVAAAHYTTH